MGDSVRIVEITKIKYWHGNFEEPNLIFVELKTTSCAGSSIVQSDSKLLCTVPLSRALL